MQSLEKSIEQFYGMSVRNLNPYRDGYLVFTPSKKLFIKKTNLGSERILFVHGAKEHLRRSGVENTDRYVETFDGRPFIEHEGSIYVMINAVEGRECDFDDRSDIKESAVSLASIHSTSKGYAPPAGAKTQDELGKLPVSFSKRLDEIRKLKKIAARGKSDFDILFINNADNFLRIGEEANRMLNGPEYSRLVEEARQSRGFCHHDYTYSNLIFTQNGLFVINFEYCRFELKVYDIANFLRRKMRKCNWLIDEATFILDVYQSVEKLSRDDFYVLGIMLRFPQKFWRAANKYYNSRRSLLDRSLLTKLRESVDELKPHSAFINAFNRLFL